MQVKEYITSLYNIVPREVYIGMLLTLILGVALVVYLKGVKHVREIVTKLLLSLYIFLIYCVTVVFRIHTVEPKLNLQPFWSYKAIFAGKEKLLVENVMNISVFIPFGFLIGLSFQSVKWWHVLIIGICTAFSIELLQYYLHRGYSEFDDVFHNIIGCMIGYGIYLASTLIIRRVRNRKLCNQHYTI